VSANENGDRDRPLTAADLAPLSEALNELREQYAELREAETPTEKREVREEIADTRDDLETLARRLGVPRKTLEESIGAAKRAERREELKPILAELLEEEREREQVAAEEGEPPKPRRKPKPKPDEPAGDEPPVADTEPVKPHWSEASIGELVR
jgi:DNA repair exonuclease SbcCD ATPase subunit